MKTNLTDAKPHFEVESGIDKIEELNEDISNPFVYQAIVLDRIEKAKQNPERLIEWKGASKKL